MPKSVYNCILAPDMRLIDWTAFLIRLQKDSNIQYQRKPYPHFPKLLLSRLFFCTYKLAQNMEQYNF